VLDPTNNDGTLDLEVPYLFGLIKVPTILARMNEPPLGNDCNVYAKIKTYGIVEIITERDIFNNGNFFIFFLTMSYFLLLFFL
jgi:hypothetical protein